MDILEQGYRQIQSLRIQESLWMSELQTTTNAPFFDYS